MNKKKLIIILIAILLLVSLLAFFITKSKKKPDQTPIQENDSGITQNFFTPYPSPISNNVPTTKISGVEIRDFYKTNPKIDELGDVVLANKQEYSIYFFPKEKYFLISITESPFQEIKLLAEKELLEILGINKNEACKLNINIGTPFFANSEEAGKVYKLSFCK